MRIRRRLLHWELAGTLFVCAAGILLRFLSSCAGTGILAAFVPVNRSVWEQMKTLFLPYLLFTLIELPRFADPFRDYFAAKAAAALAGLLTLPLLHYTVAGALGAIPAAGSIAIFCISSAGIYVTSYSLMNGFRLRGVPWQLAGFVLLLALAVLFVRFTYHPPQIPLFRDPVSFRYGIGP